MIWLYRVALLVCFITGFSLYVFSSRYEWYTVPEQEIYELSSRLSELPRDERWRLWYEELHKLETPRKRLHDLGVGVMSLAGVLGWLHYAFGFPLKESRTPKSSGCFFLVYLLVFAAQVPAAFYYFGHRQDRFEYPTWGDSIAIGLYQVIFGFACFGFIGWLILLTILSTANFPANLFVWMRSRPVMSGIVTVLFGILVVFCLSLLPGPVQDGDIGGVLLTITMLYLFLSARAGVIEHQIARQRDLQISDPS